jgi:hypothetical protein
MMNYNEDTTHTCKYVCPELDSNTQSSEAVIRAVSVTVPSAVISRYDHTTTSHSLCF